MRTQLQVNGFKNISILHESPMFSHFASAFKAISALQCMRRASKNLYVKGVES